MWVLLAITCIYRNTISDANTNRARHMNGNENKKYDELREIKKKKRVDITRGERDRE